MSHSALSQMLSRNRLDVSLAKIGVVAAVLFLGLNLVTSQVFLIVIPVAMGLGSLLYLVTRTSREETVVGTRTPTSVGTPTVSGSVVGYLPALVVLGLAGLVLYTFQAGVRTDGVYLLTGLIGTAIFVQILVAEEGRISPTLILAQILLAAVLIRLTALWVTPGYVGVDIWTHAPTFISGIAAQGDLTALAGAKYLMAPFYHVLGAIGTLALGSVRHGLYLTIGLIVPLSAVFVYSTGRLLVPTRWALLATGLFAFSDQAIRWGLHLIPTSLGLVFALAMVYAITRLFVSDAERWVIVLLLASSLALVFTHQVSTVIGLIILGVATFTAGVTVVTGGNSTPSGGVREATALGGVFVVTLVTTIVSWSVTPFGDGQSFLWGELAVLRRSITSEAGFLNLAGGSEASPFISGATSGTVVADLVPYIDVFGFSVLLLATVIGGLYMVHWTDAPALTTTHILVGGTLFVFVFGLSIFGIRALLPGRWIVFLYISMALLAAVGMYHLSQHGSRGLVVAVFLLVAVGYPATMVVAEKATLESPAFEDQYKRFAHTESEIAAVESISEIHPPDGTRTIGTDQPYVALFDRYAGYGSAASILDIGANGPVGEDAVVYRRYQSTGPVIFHRAESAPGIAFPTNVESSVCPAGWNVVYVNDDVKFCTATEGES